MENGSVSSYQYDHSNNLVSLTHSFVGSDLTFTYEYSSLSQMTGQFVSDASCINHPTTAGTVPYATAATNNSYPSVGSSPYTYNSGGCLTSDGVNTYVYNANNRLMQVNDLAGTTVLADYLYDPMNRQVQRKVGSSRTNFYYQGARRIADYDGTSLSLVRSFVYGARLDDIAIQISNSGVKTFFHADHLGSIVATSDATGVVTNRLNYDAYGNGVIPAGVSNGFTAQRYEPETGLYNYKNRNYSPSIGRFLQPDPLGYNAGMNVYQYVGDAVLNLTDPLGLMADQTQGSLGVNWGTGDFDIAGSAEGSYRSKEGATDLAMAARFKASVSGSVEVAGNFKNPYDDFGKWLSEQPDMYYTLGNNVVQGNEAEALVKRYLKYHKDQETSKESWGLSLALPLLVGEVETVCYPDITFIDKNTGEIGSAFGEVKSSWQKAPDYNSLSANQKAVYPMVKTGFSNMWGPGARTHNLGETAPRDYPYHNKIESMTPVYYFYITITKTELTAWNGYTAIG